jgi:hypothetical protein
MKTKFDTTSFENSHGRKPRGRGNWGFSFGCDSDDPRHWVFFSGSFTEAKRQAKALADSRGTDVVVVLP